MTNEPMHMRASDRDRQAVVDLLAAGLETGRLTMAEYADRMGLAYQAVTFGDLAPLTADLPPAPAAPAPAPAAPTTPAAARPAAGSAAASRCLLASLPTVLKVGWTIWLTAVSINVVVWMLISAGHGHLAYPWPLWVAGPFGALLAALSAGVTVLRSAPRPALNGSPPRVGPAR